MSSFFWYDLETFDVNPSTNRIAQFAGIRTDDNFNIITKHKPVVLYCKPTYDVLPSPQACLISGITPQKCDELGLIERDFIKKINSIFIEEDDTCIAGYNTIRFDDEFIRYTLYRNFLDPYAWHYRHGNTRWNFIDVVRMAYAFKKDESLNWLFEENKPIFKLERLASYNDIKHTKAHDALSDIEATIGLAKKLYDTQPKLIEYSLKLRNKFFVEKKFKIFLEKSIPILHTSEKYPASLSCTKLVLPICYHYNYKNRVIVFDLMQDANLILDLSLEEMQKRLFTKTEDLPEGYQRLQIKELALNKCPMFVESNISLQKKYSQLGIDNDICQKNLNLIKENKQIIESKILDLYKNKENAINTDDVDTQLYDSFISNRDRIICDIIVSSDVNQLLNFKPNFEDKRLEKLFFNFFARNYPEHLSDDMRERWFEIIQNRMRNTSPNYINIDNFNDDIDRLEKQNDLNSKICQELREYGGFFV